jgi:hypothetical protein
MYYSFECTISASSVAGSYITYPKRLSAMQMPEKLLVCPGGGPARIPMGICGGVFPLAPGGPCCIVRAGAGWCSLLFEHFDFGQLLPMCCHHWLLLLLPPLPYSPIVGCPNAVGGKDVFLLRPAEFEGPSYPLHLFFLGGRGRGRAVK